MDGWKSWIVLIAALALTLGLGACGGDEGEPELPFAQELQDALVEGLETGEGVGVSAAVIVPGYEPWVGVAGYSNPTTGERMQPDMLLDIGSTDKNFLAALTLQLVEDGKLSLDAPISNWVSGYSQIDPAVTIRQLLNSTSGIDPWEENPASPFKAPGMVGGPDALDVVDWDKEWTLDKLLTTLVGEPNFAPGEGWRYSTTNFNLAREIIEQETGMPISQAIRSRLLDPLDLDDTFVEFGQPIPDDIEFAHPWTWDFNGDGKPDDFSGRPLTWIYTSSPALIYSTAEDLARWCQALFADGEVLSQQSLGEMLTFVPAHDPEEPLVAEYGLGVGVFAPIQEEGLQHYGHGGQNFGYETLMIYLPEHQACVVSLVNDNTGSLEYTGLPLLGIVDRNLSAGE